MPWTKNDFPASMKNLPVEVRDKAIEIGNALLEERQMEEGIAIATAISRAKDWASNRGKKIENKNSNTVDVKEHGKDRYVIPYKAKQWAIRSEGSEQVERVYDRKCEAVSEARKKARVANATLAIQSKTGKIQQRISYNPRKAS